MRAKQVHAPARFARFHTAEIFSRSPDIADFFQLQAIKIVTGGMKNADAGGCSVVSSSEEAAGFTGFNLLLTVLVLLAIPLRERAKGT